LYKAAGLRDIAEWDVPVELVTESAAQYWEMISEHVSLAVAALGEVDEQARERIRATAIDRVRAYERDGTVRVPGMARCVVGTRHRLSLLASVAMDVVDDLDIAFDAAQVAAGLALTYFESGVLATLKADGTPVTEADRAVEHMLRKTLAAARPHDAFLGEEFGQIGRSDRTWILDPIDGTGFSAGATRTGGST
jgi:hypothetical protein